MYSYFMFVGNSKTNIGNRDAYFTCRETMITYYKIYRKGGIENKSLYFGHTYPVGKEVYIDAINKIWGDRVPYELVTLGSIRDNSNRIKLYNNHRRNHVNNSNIESLIMVKVPLTVNSLDMSAILKLSDVREYDSFHRFFKMYVLIKMYTDLITDKHDGSLFRNFNGDYISGPEAYIISSRLLAKGNELIDQYGNEVFK